VLAVSLVLAAPAQAAPTRAEYIAQVEPICKSNTDANTKILKGVRARIKNEKYAAAAKQFARAAQAFTATIGQIAAIEQPTADVATLTRWLGYLRLEAGYLGKAGKAIKAEKLGKAQGFVVRLQRNANLANDTVAGIGFTHCLINPAKFT